MNAVTRKILVSLFLVVVIATVAISQVKIVNERNYTLAAGETVSGMLFLLAQNAELLEGSSVDGSVVMLCCNLIVDGSVDGDVFLLTGNLRVDPHAVIAGDVKVKAGNVSR